MGTGYVRNSITEIATGEVIEADDFNNEFNDIVSSFTASTGHSHDGTAAEGGDVTKLLGTAITIGNGSAGADIVVTFDGETSDGVLTWMEDEDHFKFSDDIVVDGTNRLYFNDEGGEYIHGDGTDLNLVSGADINIPANIGLTFGDDGEKIEGDGTDLTVSSSAVLTLDAGGGITIDADSGTITFADGGVSLGTITASGYSGTSAVATVATTVTITDNEATNESNALIFTAGGDVDGGNLGLESDGTLTYNPSTGVVTGKVTATGFIGTLTGNVTGTADVATVATTVTITDNEATNESNALIFTAGGDVDGGDLGLESDGTLTYNPSTGTVTATGFVGALTGNVTGNASGTAATVTGAAQANITSLGTLTGLTVDDVDVNGKVITMTGDTGDTTVITAGAAGTLSIVTTDAAGADGNITITADGTFEADGTTITLDSAGDIELNAGGGDVFFKAAATTFGSATNSSGELVLKSGTTTALTFSGANATLAGDLTISGDDLFMATNTSGHILVADGTNYNPVAVSGDVGISAAGAITIASTAVESGMLNNNIISGQTELASGVASTDEILISDAGTLKRMDVSVLTEITDGSATALAIALG
jgi:hypothetical protein